MTQSPKSQAIARLNDAFRKTFLGGQVLITCGIQALSEADQVQVLAKVRDFNRFTEDNDPYGEHDFGSFSHASADGEIKVFWKIDTYDLDLLFASPDPADPSKTRRVLTVLLAEEY